MLQSDFCDCSDTYIVVRGLLLSQIQLMMHVIKKLVLKDHAPFISCISKINNILIDNAEDLNLVMPKYNLIEYSKNYSETTGSLWNYYRDEPNSGLGSTD